MAGNRPTPEKFEFSLDARQVAGVILGSLGALALAFYLGHVLGRRVVESPAVAVRPPVAAPKAADPLAALDHAPAPAVAEPTTPLSFHETLTSSRPPPDRLPPVPKGQAPVSPPPATKTAAGVVPVQAPAAAAVAPVAPAVSATPAPVPAPPSAGAATSQASGDVPHPASAKPTPAATPGPAAAAPSSPPLVDPAPRSAPAAKPSGRGGWSLQVISTTDRHEADKVASRLSSRGARVTPTQIQGKTWFRVRLGPYDSRESADRVRREVEQSTRLHGMVVPPA